MKESDYQCYNNTYLYTRLGISLLFLGGYPTPRRIPLSFGWRLCLGRCSLLESGNFNLILTVMACFAAGRGCRSYWTPSTTCSNPSWSCRPLPPCHSPWSPTINTLGHPQGHGRHTKPRHHRSLIPTVSTRFRKPPKYRPVNTQSKSSG